jgi:hypothetical protein
MPNPTLSRPLSQLPRHANLRRLATAGLDLVEVAVPADAALSGQLVAQLFLLHPDAIPVAVQRGRTWLHPRGDARLQAGDHIYAVVPVAAIAPWHAAVTRPAPPSDGPRAFLRLPHRDLGPRVPGGL